MQKPHYYPGEVIMSDKIMGVIIYGFFMKDENEWKYLLQVDTPDASELAVAESEVKAVLRASKWQQAVHI